MSNFQILKNEYNNNKLGLLLILILISILIYFIYQFTKLDPTLKVGIIAGSVAIAVPLISNIIQKKRELEFKIREKKIESYTKIFDFLKKFVESAKSENIDQDEFVAINRNVSFDLLLNGSDRILSLWYDFWQMAVAGATAPEENATDNAYYMRGRAAYMIREIRKDIGYSDKIDDINMIADLFMPINFETDQQREDCYSATLAIQIVQDKNNGKSK